MCLLVPEKQVFLRQDADQPAAGQHSILATAATMAPEPAAAMAMMLWEHSVNGRCNNSLNTHKSTVQYTETEVQNNAENES